MELIRPIEDKIKAARSGSRLQNRACDQCRRSKRRCDLAEAGPDGLPLQHDGPCKLCVRKNLQCTTHWSALQQTVSSSRQELRHISQTSSSYSALQDQLSSHQYLPAGLSTASKSMSDHIDGLYISTKQLFTYVAAWEWIWQHFLGSGATPAGVGLDAAVHPRRGLLSGSAARAWDDMMVVNNVPHVSPNFFYSTFVCDEAYRPSGRFKRLPKKAEEISMQALQYAIVAYASQYGSQNPGEWRGNESDVLRRRKDAEIAEAAWMRARNYLMAHSSVTTFRMAYALHLFCNTCPPLRSTNSDLDVVQDSVFMLQNGLRMMDDLATDLLRQQDDDLFALGYQNTDGARIDDEVLLRSDPGYRARVDRAHALKDVAENLLWYSAICDAATTGGFGMPPVVRASTRDKVDIDALQLSTALLPATVSPAKSAAPDNGMHVAAGSFGSMADASAPFLQNGFGSMPAMAHNPDQSALQFEDASLLRLGPGLMMANGMDGDLDASTRDWTDRTHNSVSTSQGLALNTDPKHLLAGALSSPVSAASDSPSAWTLVAHRALHLSKQIPYSFARFAAAPGDPVRVKEFLNLCQAGASTQIMIWQRNGNFRACLDNPDSTSAELAEQFQRTWTMILFVQQVFQPLLDLDAHLYSQMPASAQSVVTHLINQVGMGSLIFLEICSFLEGMPWVQGSKDPSWPRASSMLRNQLDQSREMRSAVRRRSALRIGRLHGMVARQVEHTLRSGGGSPPRDAYSSGQSSPGGAGDHGHRGSDAGLSTSSEFSAHGRIDIPLPQDDMIVPALQIHSSRHPVPTHLAAVLHISFCALVPDALQEISQHGVASSMTLDAIDADLRGLQGILDCVLSFGTGFHREPGLETVFSTRNWLAPHRQPIILDLR
ncbi:Zn(2)-C6 fungal-type DNA-binding domain protein [Kalmanozyma brasiliensis GHG001]|uniref:Zn(2)-C6 fungal-type DNA-binding domain protein n=1 Tax=Kalmanozyma brasiliensis (strain GHG001) TaxID=1365824 RepID=UPI0028680C76|nr:Zn(2)-C6 fungal-type DNA-binding domain protein [Kalmanozyma brasiliensis GHG001]EST10078.2 Zn(2)-C6 fungal-type DNA-binding domain protein [Kalmanozyma brasiliensis GHG001]